MGMKWTEEQRKAGGYTAAGQKYSGQCGSRLRKDSRPGTEDLK